jgi:hypothetical protein
VTSLIRKLRGSKRSGRNTASLFEDEATERLLMLNGQSACRLLPRNTPIDSLADVEFRVFSQWGEDGIVEWLAAHVAVPNTRFVEFGVESFREANCRFLMMNRNWRGLVMDGSEDNMCALKAHSMHWKYDLNAAQAFVTAENINQLLAAQGFAGPLGILSIDIDGNDYWVWKSITVADAAIVVCESNPILGDTAPIVVPYDPAFTRFAGHYSGLYFGASIAALRLLAEQRGYEFLGTNSNGINAFFVRKDLAKQVLPLLRTIRAYPALHRDSRDVHSQLNYVRGVERFNLIRDLPVIDVASNRQMALSEIRAPYSAEWLAALS